MFIILIIFLLLLSVIFYKKYFQIKNKISEIKKETKTDDEKIENKKINEENKDANIIQNLRYVSEDLFGNTYILSATSAEIIKDDIDNVNLFNVNGEIIQDDGQKIEIISKTAKYNRQNNNTLFENVLVLYRNLTIETNIVNMTLLKFNRSIENVYYTNENIKMFANCEIDLLKNKLKISMKDQKNKIQVLGEN